METQQWKNGKSKLKEEGVLSVNLVKPDSPNEIDDRLNAQEQATLIACENII